MKSAAVFFVALAGLVVAAPATDATAKDHVLIFYTEPNYKGRSSTVNAKPRECTNLRRKVDDKVSSIINDDKILCHYYVKDDCGGRNFQSSTDEPDLKGRFDDALSSFQCE